MPPSRTGLDYSFSGERYVQSFEKVETDACRRDVSWAEVNILGAGHFALDTKLVQIAEFVDTFLKRDAIEH